MLKVHAEQKTVTVAQDASFEGQPGCQENRLSVAFHWTDQPHFQIQKSNLHECARFFFRNQNFQLSKTLLIKGVLRAFM